MRQDEEDANWIQSEAAVASFGRFLRLTGQGGIMPARLPGRFVAFCWRFWIGQRPNDDAFILFRSLGCS